MTIKRVVGFITTLLGGLLLAVVAIGVALSFYYRPTLEYAYIEGPQQPIPPWLTGELIKGLLGTLLGIVGGLLLWTGRRWRRA
jgi:hypothetical protein